MRTRTICSALALLALAGCGDEEERPARAPAQVSTVLVTVYPKGEDTGPIETETVSCAEEPDRCAVPLEPTAPGTACTRIYGGPAVATVHGGIDGRSIDARFSMADGCEIDRWKKASALLGEPPGGAR